MDEHQEHTGTEEPGASEGTPIGLLLLLVPLAFVGAHLLWPEVFVLKLLAIVVALLVGTIGVCWRRRGIMR